MKKTYTVSLVFTTQRKRKVFVDDKIMDFTRQKVQEGLKENGASLDSMDFDSGCVAMVKADIPIEMSMDEAFRIIKKASSDPIKNEFSAFSKMVSVWTRSYWGKIGRINKGDEKEIRMFVLQQRDR